MRKVRKLTKAKAGVRFQPSTTRGLRSVRIRSGTFDPEARTFEFVLASETPCRSYRIDERWNCIEIDEVLPMSALVGLDTFRGAPLLDTHSSWSVRDVLGRITALRVEGTELVASAFLSSRDDVAGVAADIASGVLQEFSVGFDVLEDGEPEDQESGIPLVRIRRWTVREGSLVPIPADNTAVIRSARARGRTPLVTNEGKRAVTAEELKAKLTEIFATATDSIVEAVTEDEGADDDATIEAEAEAAAEEARQAVLAKKGKTPAAAPAAEPARAAPKQAGAETPAARAAAVLRLRKAAERNGVLEDFNDLEATGATIKQLQTVVLAGVQTSDDEIDTSTRSSGGAPTKPIRMAGTPAGKKLAKVTK